MAFGVTVVAVAVGGEGWRVEVVWTRWYVNVHFFLPVIGLSVVEVVEVGHDHGNGQSDGQHASNGTQRPH